MTNPRDRLHNVWGRLFQAAMWRKYAAEWDGPDTSWVANVLQKSKAECIRRSRANVYLARRLNRRRLETSADKLVAQQAIQDKPVESESGT